MVTTEYRHGTLVEVVIANIGGGDAKNVTFEFSAPMESSVSYRRDSEIVPLSELPHFREGMSYLAPGAEIATVWDDHVNLVPLLREMGLQGDHGYQPLPVAHRGAPRDPVDDQPAAHAGGPLRPPAVGRDGLSNLPSGRSSKNYPSTHLSK